jgi:hypothetical protein
MVGDGIEVGGGVVILADFFWQRRIEVATDAFEQRTTEWCRISRGPAAGGGGSGEGRLLVRVLIAFERITKTEQRRKGAGEADFVRSMPLVVH